ncbi:hypothetical protein RRG08_050403 [Elysia crispata]|uniref:Uncharacterized protein n=1 Tax=Elysia crispata TaxID=231223 RepID=A0AAE0YVQ6_9GAST|nr:hypothetical protein RRG08_050403 [Elysia crispata]
MAIHEITRVGEMLSHIDSPNPTLLNANGTASTNDTANPGDNQEHPSACEVLETLKDQNNSANQGSDILDIQPGCEKLAKEVKSKRHICWYTKWSSEDTDTVKSYFHIYIASTQSSGSLPPKSEIMEFLNRHDILHDHENKYMLVRSKVFNEKKKFMSSFKGI